MAEIHSYLGMALAEQAKLNLAVVHFRMAIEIDPEILQAYSNLVSVFSKKEEIQSSKCLLYFNYNSGNTKSMTNYRIQLEGNLPSRRNLYYNF